jgi:transcriptional regulator with XRE-family HTH domain
MAEESYSETLSRSALHTYAERVTISPSATSALQQTVIAEIRANLGRRGLSARQAAFKLGWTEYYMSRRMTGKLSFTLDDLEALAGVLDVEVSDFFAVPGRTLGRGMINAVKSRLLTRDLRRRPALQHLTGFASRKTGPFLQQAA